MNKLICTAVEDALKSDQVNFLSLSTQCNAITVVYGDACHKQGIRKWVANNQTCFSICPHNFSVLNLLLLLFPLLLHHHHVVYILYRIRDEKSPVISVFLQSFLLSLLPALSSSWCLPVFLLHSQVVVHIYFI